MMKRLGLLLLLLAGPAYAVGTVAPTTQAIVVSWDSNTPVQGGTVPVGSLPWSSGKVISCTYYTGGSSASFTAQVLIGSTAVTGCNAMSVSSPTPATVSATANNTFSAGNVMSVVITGVTNTPVNALVQINIQSTAN
jgi:hypothetical protein